MDNREEPASEEYLAHVIGLPVVEPDGTVLGVVVGRIISGTTIDLLVRRRHLFHRSRYMRLQGAAISRSGRTLVYQPVMRTTVRLAVVRPSGPEGNRKGDAA